LVSFLNTFANPRIALPRGWTSKTDAAGKVYLIKDKIKSSI